MSTVNSATSSALGATSASSAVGATTAKEASERFLKLLVTQLQNQDPLNPVDNAQMTSQMAQISTVSGIEKLNDTVSGLNQQFVQMQIMQGASLVGKDVVMPGDKLQEAEPGVASGTYELPTAVRNVKVEVLSASGNRVLDTFNLFAQSAGRHDFTWPTKTEFSQADGLRFRVIGQSGETVYNATELVRDRVDAVNTSGASLTLELARSGHVPYSAISAID